MAVAQATNATSIVTVIIPGRVFSIFSTFCSFVLILYNLVGVSNKYYVLRYTVPLFYNTSHLSIVTELCYLFSVSLFYNSFLGTFSASDKNLFCV